MRIEKSEWSAPEPSRLADMGLLEAITVSAETRVSEISPGVCAWIVLLEEGSPVAAVPASALPRIPPDSPVLAAVRERPAAVIADADAPVAGSLASWAFTQLAADGAAVIVDDDRGCRVWAGEDLAAVRDLAGRRSAIDTRLPGDESRIAKLCRICRFEYGEGKCAAFLSFAEFPEPMPECPNPGGLSPHHFVW